MLHVYMYDSYDYTWQETLDKIFSVSFFLTGQSQKQWAISLIDESFFNF